MRYDILREYCTNDDDVVRLNTYISYDEERAGYDMDYREKQQAYFSIIRNMGFKVITKAIRRYYNEEGVQHSKADADLDIAIDTMEQSDRLDKVVLLSGDGDFKRLVTALQTRGVRVELIAFRNISRDLKEEVDHFISGFLIPSLVPIEGQEPEDWGLIGFRTRGICYAIADNYGFFKFYDLDMQLQEIFFHFSALPKGDYVRLDKVYEFTVEENERGLIATEIELP